MTRGVIVWAHGRVQMALKRRRTMHAHDEADAVVAEGRPRYVWVWCMDDTSASKLMQVSVDLLDASGCRLSKQVEHDAPEVDETGKAYYRVCMTRAMMQTFVRALTHGEMTLSKGVSLSEAMSTFEYENLTFNVPPEMRSQLALRRAPLGVGHSKHEESAASRVKLVCEQVATALTLWPRLEFGLESVPNGTRCSFTATATRVWVRFCSKPAIFQERVDSTLTLAKKWPRWLHHTMTAIGIRHYRIARDGRIDARARDAETFAFVQKEIESDMLGPFFAMRYDAGKACPDREHRKDVMKGEKFANEMRNTILDFTSTSGASSGLQQQTIRNVDGCAGAAPAVDDAVLFARGWVGFSESVMHGTPSIAAMFSGKCCDDSGKTLERLELGRSLQSRGVKLVCWMDSDPPAHQSVVPLVFPSGWREGTSGAGGGVACSPWSTALLDFSGCS